MQDNNTNNILNENTLCEVDINVETVETLCDCADESTDTADQCTHDKTTADEVLPNKPKRVSGWSYEAHIVKCESCGRDVLDHMTQCPFCKEPLTLGYKPMSKKTTRIVKYIALAVGLVIAAVIIIPILINRFGG